MAFLTELDIINSCLASMGETPLNAIDADHPYVAAAQLKLKTCLTQEQAKGWWFNTDYLSIAPDPNTKFIYLPNDCINVNPNDAVTNAWVQRGRRLWNRAESTFEFDAPVAVEVVRELPLDQLPMLAQHVISARTTLDFQNDFDGDAQKYNKLGGAYQQAYSTLRAEHIRNVKGNLLQGSSVAAKLNQLQPMSRYLRPSYPRFTR
jgi:hypothetical protein